MQKLIGILAFLLCVGSAGAQYGHRYYPNYNYGYGYNYYQPSYYYKEVVIPVFTAQSLVIDPSFKYIYLGSGASVAQQYQQTPQVTQPCPQGHQTTAPPVVNTQQIDQFLDLLEKRMRERGKTLQYPSQERFTLPPSPTGLQPISLQDQPPQVEQKTFFDVMTLRCSRCHTEGRLKSNSMPLFTADGRLHPSWSAQDVWDAAVVTKHMPPKGSPKLQDDEIEIFRRDFKVQ